MSINVTARWSFDETSGNPVDTIASITLTDTNTVGTAAGKLGNARDFESGSSQYFICSDHANLSMGDIDFTILVWVNAESFGTDRTIISKSAGSGIEYDLQYQSSSQRFMFRVSTSGFASYDFIEANNFGAPSTGTWYFIVCWHDSVANTINIQVNNGTADSKAYSGGSYNSTNDFTIGATYSGSQFWDGLIDEPVISKSVLTAGERTTLWNSGNGLAYPYSSGGAGPLVGGSLLKGAVLRGRLVRC